MYKFNAQLMFEAEIRPYRPYVERRGAFLDIYMQLDPGDQSWPEDLTEPGALVICDEAGVPIEYVVQSEGCDCEYRFTEDEKEQLRNYMKAERLVERAQ